MKHLSGVIGSGGGGGGGGGGGTTVAAEAPNDLRSRATTRGLGIVSEGEIVGLVDGAKSIFFDSTPLEADDGSLNFEGVTWWERTGTPDQDHIPGFPSVENEVNVNATVTNSTPVIRTITNPDVDAVRVRMQLTQGLMKQEDNSDLMQGTVSLAIDVRASGGDWVEMVADTISGKTMSAYERAFRIELEGSAPWDIRPRRVTEDNDTSKIRDELAFAAYTEIIDAKLIYPDTAVMGLAIDAEKFGNAVPQVSFEIKGIKVQVPTNYDPETREYSGLWDGTFKLAWTDNPAWCVYDMMMHDRYGLGVLDIDKWALYELAQYCDELVPDGYGGTEPRFVLNCVIQTREDAYHVVNTLISACRGLCYWGSGAVTFSQDRPAEPSHIAGPADVENGDFIYQGTGIRGRHTVALVTWNDPDDGYLPAVEVVEHSDGIARYGWQPTDVVAFGCTSRGQAHRLGKWILDTEQNETETVSFVGGFDFADAVPGNLVSVADPTVAGVRMAGRIKSATVSQVVIDAPITIQEGEGYILTVVLPDKTTADATITNAPGVADTLDLAEALSEAPQAGAMWVVTATNVAPRLFRILANRETAAHKFEITGLEHDATKFARVEQDIEFDPKPVSLIPTGPLSKPINPAFEEYIYTSGEGVAPGLMFSWSHSGDPRVVRYEVQVKRPGDEWEEPTIVSGCSIRCSETRLGEYSFRVRGLSSSGVASPWLLVENLDVLGLAQTPETVTGLLVLVQNGSTVLVWDEIDDLRTMSYEVRKGASWPTNQLIGVTEDRQITVGGNGVYMVKAKVGTAYSEEAAVAVVVSDALTANVIATSDEKAGGWIGDITGGARVDENGDLRLFGLGDVYGVPDVYTEGDIYSLGGVTGEGAYHIPAANIVSLDQAALCNVQLDYSIVAYGIFDNIETAPDIYDLTDVYGGFGKFVSAEPQIRLFNGTAWGEWQRYIPGQYAAEQFDFRIILKSYQADVTPILGEFTFSVDVPDRVVTRSALAVPPEGFSLSFDPPFNVTPSIVCQVLDAAGGEDVEITNESPSGCDIRITTGGVSTAEFVNIIAQGY